MKTVYTYDLQTKQFTGVYDAQESPLEPGEYILPECCTEVAPPVFNADTHTCTWSGIVWIKLPIVATQTQEKAFADLKADKAFEIDAACEAAIIAGFASSALGAPHLYPAKQYDQLNLSGSVQKSTLPSALPDAVYPFMCADSAGVWEYRAHSAVQIQQVGSDAYDAIMAKRQKSQVLQAQIAAATTVNELSAIVW